MGSCPVRTSDSLGSTRDACFSPFSKAPEARRARAPLVGGVFAAARVSCPLLPAPALTFSSLQGEGRGLPTASPTGPSVAL